MFGAFEDIKTKSIMKQIKDQERVVVFDRVKKAIENNKMMVINDFVQFNV